MPEAQEQTRATHTPGPWHLSKNGRFVRKANGATDDGPKDFNICEVWLTGDDEGQSVADAHLIAAAPDLIAACASAAELLKKLVNMNRLPANSAALRECVAAIAKAEGR